MRTTDDRALENLAKQFEQLSSVETLNVDIRRYPDEVNIIIYVASADFTRAVEAAAEQEHLFQDAGSVPRFLVVRKAAKELEATTATIKSVHDPRVMDLVRLISAKSRVSSAEPGLVYLPDSRASLSAVTAARHHLIFGRRGAGKSALLMEARRFVSDEGSTSSWTNVQTLRRESPQRVYLYLLMDLLSALISNRTHVSERSELALGMSEVFEDVRQLLALDSNDLATVERVVPRAQRAISRFLSVEGVAAFMFIDDFYYVPREAQPLLLDMLHGTVRDARVWLKIASIRHLSSWWQASPPVGLQSGQDADIIDLDVTLQDPNKASMFLEGILAEYARRVGITTLARVFNRSALDRLVLASGAVPRDYITLAVGAISRAQRRPNARFAGVQDVNQAAGDAAGSKLQELEEDMAANRGVAERTLKTLAIVRNFCLDETSFTYFLVSLREKEKMPRSYNLLADLMDVRLLHLVDSGISDPHEAGSRFEAYMLDLSQFSGSRLKQRITVLDFEDGHFISRETRSSKPAKTGRLSRELVALLRVAPTLPLEKFDQLST